MRTQQSELQSDSERDQLAKKNSLKQQADFGKWSSEVKLKDLPEYKGRNGSNLGESGPPLTLSIEAVLADNSRKRRRASAGGYHEITTASNLEELFDGSSKLGVVTPCFQKGAVREIDSADKIMTTQKPPLPPNP